MERNELSLHPVSTEGRGSGEPSRISHPSEYNLVTTNRRLMSANDKFCKENRAAFFYTGRHRLNNSKSSLHLPRLICQVIIRRAFWPKQGQKTRASRYQRTHPTTGEGADPGTERSGAAGGNTNWQRGLPARTQTPARD